jgi:cellulose synthase/poly-beta-1,6-N-acetylglucosamine synthase-like glycosyltransferase
MRSRGIRRVGAAWLWLSTAGIVGFYLRLVWESWLGARLARRAGGPALALASPQPRVSVIVPARNEARNIRRCVASLLGQAYPDFEVIVVDDGSTDATPQILSELRHGAGGDRLRIIPAGELPAGWAGKPHAMAVGAAAATGAWLLFTDADTLHRPGALAWAAREAQRRAARIPRCRQPHHPAGRGDGHHHAISARAGGESQTHYRHRQWPIPLPPAGDV